MKNENSISKVSAFCFVTKVCSYHVFTYLICGMIFSTVFNYKDLFVLGNMAYFMIPMESVNTLAVPVFQILRGVLFGLILLLLRNIINTRKGFLKLYGIILVIGIINTPGPAPSSIEGLVYTQLPWDCHVFGAPEIIVQTFLFSLLVSTIDRSKVEIPLNIKKSAIAASLCMIFYAIGGVILASILKVDYHEETSKISSYITLLITGLICFAITYFVIRQKRPMKVITVLYVFFLYLMCAVYPFILNYVKNTPYNSPLGLIISALPVVAVVLYIKVADYFNLCISDMRA